MNRWMGSAAMALILAGSALPVMAQGGPVATETTRHMAFEIPAQDLNTALLAFADRAGVQIFYEAAAVQGLRSGAVSGALTVSDALGRLLAGTGYTYHFTGAGRVVLEKIPTDGAMMLGPVTVQGANPAADAEATAWSPVKSFVAKRSATGTKTDTPLVETAQSISVVTREQMEKQGIQNLNDALRYTSGVIPETRGAIATRYDMMKIRGFDAVNYWDGLRFQKLNYIAPQIDPYLLERAEVLKGPSSVLYGQAPAGGMVNQVSKMPTETTLNEAGIEFGTNDHWVGTYDMAGPANAEKTILYRITAVGRREDGQVTDSKSDRVAIMPSLTLRGLSSGTSLTLNALFQRDPHANTYAGVPVNGTVIGNPHGQVATDFNVSEPDFETFDRTQMAVGYRFEHPVNDDTTVRLNGRWFSSQLDYASVYASSLQADQRTMTRAVAISHDELDTLSFDNQLEHRVATGAVNHTVLGGIDYQSWSGYYVGGWGSGASYVAPIDIFNPVYAGGVVRTPTTTRTDAEGTQTGLYLQDQMDWNHWRLGLAGRWDWARNRIRNATGLSIQDDYAFTGRASLLYAFDNGLSPYVSYAESFTPQAGTDFNGTPFDPEEGQQHEVGIKYQPPGTTSLYTASVFDLDRKNLTTSDPDHSGYSVQTGEARSRGVELEAKISATENWDLIGSYTYLDTRYTEDTQYDGFHLSGVPRHMASLWSNYTLSSGPLNGLGFGGGVRYRSDTYTTNNQVKVQDYALVDAALSYDLGQASSKLAGTDLALNVKNLLDREHVVACFTNTSCAYGYGRTVTATLRMRW